VNLANLSLDTEPFPPAERFPYWRDALQTHLGLKASCAHGQEQSFRANLTQYAIGRTLLREVSGMPHTVDRMNASADRRIVVQLQIEGWSMMQLGEQSIRLDPGQIAVYRNNKPIHAEKNGRFHHIFLGIPEDCFAEAAPNWPQGDRAMCISASQGTAAVFADLLFSLTRQARALDAAGLEDIAGSTVKLLLATLPPLVGEAPAEVSHLEAYHKGQIKQFVKSNIHNPALDVRTIATGVNLSIRYVHRLFSSEPMRLMQWVMAQRLDHCHNELSSDIAHRTISEIAYGWGFNDPAHFSKAFRKRYGVSPREVHGRNSSRSEK
jgi:AraC-like DNA-binding protein